MDYVQIMFALTVFLSKFPFLHSRILKVLQPLGNIVVEN